MPKPIMQLPNVLWLGGSQCAGKSTIAWLLAQKYGLQFYRYDSMEMEHARRGSPEHRAEFDAFVGLSMDERWLLPSPEETAERAIRSSIQRFPLVIEDLEAMSAAAPVIAEGPGLYPQLVQPYMASPHHGIWLIPTRDINFECRSSRPKSSYSQTSDPPTALQKLVERDMLLAAYVKQRAEELNLRWFEVDGSKSIAEVAAIVEAHFTPALKSSQRIRENE